jgi:outer membrane receptor protein involved in Fe transport
MEHTKRTDEDWLPAVNAVYALSKQTNLRAAYALTVARPNFREVAPALYYDYVRRRAIGGNPDLEETRIHNADVRWETFLSETELVAASVFYKHFVKPIEKTLSDAGSGENVGFQNAVAADTYGLELEAKIGLARLTSRLSQFTVGGNLSLIRSQIDLDGARRPLQGQSPYVVNVGIGYESEAAGTQVDLLYNAFGARIDEVGTGGLGSVYEQPIHRLDLTFSKKLPNRLKLKLAGTNLLGARVVRLQNGVEIYAYQQGITVAGSLEMSLD